MYSDGAGEEVFKRISESESELSEEAGLRFFAAPAHLEVIGPVEALLPQGLLALDVQ